LFDCQSAEILALCKKIAMLEHPNEPKHTHNVGEEHTHNVWEEHTKDVEEIGWGRKRG
jgi:hypothetical protein